MSFEPVTVSPPSASRAGSGSRVLVAEDDSGMADSLQEGLARHGYAVIHASNGREALELAPDADLVLLDLGLPDLDGMDVCRRLRERSMVPIIVITARSDEIDRVLLLELGADDYVVKPFGFRELVARIGALLRRSNAGTTASIDVQHCGRLEIERRARRVRLDGDEVSLTPKEFDLLALLAQEPGVVRTREEIIDSVWDPHWFGPTKTLDVHVASLRRKLRRAVEITPVRGIGYRLEVPG